MIAETASAYATLAADQDLLALARQTPVIDRWKVLLLAAYLGVVLLLCKSLASQAYALLLVPMPLLASTTTRARWTCKLP